MQTFENNLSGIQFDELDLGDDEPDVLWSIIFVSFKMWKWHILIIHIKIQMWDHIQRTFDLSDCGWIKSKNEFFVKTNRKKKSLKSINLQSHTKIETELKILEKIYR